MPCPTSSATTATVLASRHCRARWRAGREHRVGAALRGAACRRCLYPLCMPRTKRVPLRARLAQHHRLLSGSYSV